MLAIFSSGNNLKYSLIAMEYGFKIGARLPARVGVPLTFADQNWKAPNRPKYMAALAHYRPTLATVIDIERLTQYETAMSWAEEAQQYVDKVIVIPKVSGIIDLIPDTYILGYSVPTGHGKTRVPLREFGQRPVHLLGGHPEKQYELAQQLNVVSFDQNYIQKMAMYGRAYGAGKGTTIEANLHISFAGVLALWGKFAE